MALAGERTIETSRFIWDTPPLSDADPRLSLGTVVPAYLPPDGDRVVDHRRSDHILHDGFCLVRLDPIALGYEHLQIV